MKRDARDDSDEGGSFSTTTGIGLACGFLCLYVLSIGPFVYLAASGIISESKADLILNTFYAPLVYLHEESNVFKEILDTYIELWL